MSDGYEMIDRFLRNNLDDDDYAEYSEALDGLCSPAQIIQQGEPVAIYRYEPATLSYGVEWLIKGTLADRTPLYTSAPAIQEGYVLVPVEPTPEMIHEGQMSRLCPVSGSESTASIYRAMLAAAPKGEPS